MKITKLYRRAWMLLWVKSHTSEGNVHAKAETSKLVTIPFSKQMVNIRPTVSDVGRVREYQSKIYFDNSYLHSALKKNKPTTLIDIGANIGLSTLAFCHEFTTLKKVIAIEAETENFKMLRKNFKLFSKTYKNVEFQAIHAIASCTPDFEMQQTDSIADLTQKNSASGTFRYVRSSKRTSKQKTRNQSNIVCIQDVFDQLPDEENVIVKIDIEGGEEYLLSQNTTWCGKVDYITMELHDRFHPNLLNSSRHIFKVLANGNFATAANKDVIHCYNRHMIEKHLNKNTV